MPFSEAIKLEVKHKSAFRCCICQVIDIEVHHIIPEGEGGPSVIENAAPLCPNCHDKYGDNTKKRKFIRQMRDWWYGECQKMYSSSGPLTLELLSSINQDLELIKTDQDKQEVHLNELKTTLAGLTKMNVNTITAGSAIISASGIVNTATAYQIQPEYCFLRTCNNCGVESLVSNHTVTCPNCGTAY